MTLPKGYKPPSPNNNNSNNYRPIRPRKNKGWGRAILSLIFFIIFLILTIHFAIQYMQEGKEIDELKKVVAKAKIEYEEAFKDVYGRYPSPSEYPH